MKLSDFDYGLPKELIAQYPLKQRDEARLLVLNRDSGEIEHCVFKDVGRFFKKDDLLILNDTKVTASRLVGKRATGGRVEVLLLGRESGMTFDALIKPGRVKLGERIIFNGGDSFGTLTAKNKITFNLKDVESVYRLGAVPLPPYIKREPEELDADYYQTVYARNEGAIASPTAGLHFTNDLLSELEKAGINIGYVTLHVNYSTFKSIKTDDITEYKMDKERFSIGDKTVSLINHARAQKNRIIAVGTTSCRTLETFADGKSEGETDIYIYPGYQFKMSDCLLTNFHLPKTTLYILVNAFAGEKLIKKAYNEAIKEKYRFYSYGDAMLIL